MEPGAPNFEKCTAQCRHISSLHVEFGIGGEERGFKNMRP
jgi:hypothetical protein